MKFVEKSLLILLLSLLMCSFGFSQSPVKNIFVVMEENRTPDNLFQTLCNSYACGTGTNQFDIAQSGECLYNEQDYNIRSSRCR